MRPVADDEVPVGSRLEILIEAPHAQKTLQSGLKSSDRLLGFTAFLPIH
jgi:hypothetical protein